jgi:hypothetical protein
VEQVDQLDVRACCTHIACHTNDFTLSLMYPHQRTFRQQQVGLWKVCVESGYGVANGYTVIGQMVRANGKGCRSRYSPGEAKGDAERFDDRKWITFNGGSESCIIPPPKHTHTRTHNMPNAHRPPS